MQRSKNTMIGVGAACALALLLASCSASAVIDRIPNEVGGLPDAAPQRPVEKAAYPAVHDVPQDRADLLTEADRLKLEKELDSARKTQGGMQDPTVRARGEAANAKSVAAGDKAREAAGENAKKKPAPPAE